MNARIYRMEEASDKLAARVQRLNRAIANTGGRCPKLLEQRAAAVARWQCLGRWIERAPA